MPSSTSIRTCMHPDFKLLSAQRSLEAVQRRLSLLSAPRAFGDSYALPLRFLFKSNNGLDQAPCITECKIRGLLHLIKLKTSSYIGELEAWPWQIYDVRYLRSLIPYDRFWRIKGQILLYPSRNILENVRTWIKEHILLCIIRCNSW